MILHLFLLWFSLFLQVPPLSAPVDPAKVKALSREEDRILGEERKRLAELADSSAASGDSATARAVRDLIELEPPKDGPRSFSPLPEIVPAVKEDKADVPVPPALIEAHQVRADSAKKFLDLSLRAGKIHRLALADSCLRKVLERSRNHATARKLLGFIPHNGGWATPYAARKLKDGWTLHPTYGWVESSWVIHLEQGELPGIGGDGRGISWIPAAEADSLRRNFARPWTINTEHFQIRTNAGLAEGIAFARRIEDFRQLFFALFADLIGPSHPLAVRLEGKEPRTKLKPHLIDYFSSRADFVAYLRERGIDAKDSLGYYDPPFGSNKRNPSYFYKDDGGEISSLETLYHETSHQLLFENAGPALFERNLGNYWTFEGLGTYFETVRPQENGSILIGGRVGRRFEIARQRILVRKEFTPIDRFVAMGKKTFFDPPQGDVYLNYGQAMALTLYLLESDRGRYRDAFLDYVRDVYKGRYKPHAAKPLDERLGSTYPTLDRDFLQFLAEPPNPSKP